MKEETRKKIIVAASVAKPTQKQLSQLLNGWDEYFRRFKIDSSNEEIEFDMIIKTRLTAGSISLVAPTCDIVV